MYLILLPHILSGLAYDFSDTDCWSKSDSTHKLCFSDFPMLIFLAERARNSAWNCCLTKKSMPIEMTPDPSLLWYSFKENFILIKGSLLSRLHHKLTRPWPHIHCAWCWCGRKVRRGDCTPNTRPWPHTHCARCRCGRKGRSGDGRQPGPRSAHSPAPVTVTAQGLHAGTPPGVSCTSLAAGCSVLPSGLGPSAGSAAGRLLSPAGRGCEKLLPDN